METFKLEEKLIDWRKVSFFISLCFNGIIFNWYDYLGFRVQSFRLILESGDPLATPVDKYERNMLFQLRFSHFLTFVGCNSESGVDFHMCPLLAGLSPDFRYQDVGNVNDIFYIFFFSSPSSPSFASSSASSSSPSSCSSFPFSPSSSSSLSRFFSFAFFSHSERFNPLRSWACA